MLSVTQQPNVLVSSDFKYFKVSANDCCRSPCKEIVSSTTHVNVASLPLYFITPFNGATMALLLTTGNVPFEMTLKPLDETMKICQNLVSFHDAMRIVGDIVNMHMFQRLYVFYANTLEELRREPICVESQPIHTEQSHHDPSVYIVEDDTPTSTEVLSDAEILDLFNLDVEEQTTEDQSIDDFLDNLFDNNILEDIDML
jgi:hypothetical protein